MYILKEANKKTTEGDCLRLRYLNTAISIETPNNALHPTAKTTEKNKGEPITFLKKYTKYGPAVNEAAWAKWKKFAVR